MKTITFYYLLFVLLAIICIFSTLILINGIKAHVGLDALFIIGMYSFISGLCSLWFWHKAELEREILKDNQKHSPISTT